MELPTLNKQAQSVARFSIVFMLMATVTVIATGWSARGIHEEVKILELYMKNSEGVQSNFENSLTIYTENTEEAIAFVHSLRPGDELEYIEFISELEDLGQSLGLNLDLSSDEAESGVDATGSNSLVYQVQFYGSYDQLNDFMEGVNNLPYYVRVDAFDFMTLSALDDEDLKRPNVSITLRLYVE